MFRHISRLRPLFILWSSFLLAMLNALSFESPAIGLTALILYAVSASVLLGPTMLPKQKIVLQAMAGFMSVVGILSISVSVIYYALFITKPILLIVFFIFSLILTILGKHAQTRIKSKRLLPRLPLLVIFSSIAIILSLSAWFSIILDTTVLSSIRSPWDAVPMLSIIALGIALLFLLTIFHKKRAVPMGSLLFALTLFASISMAAIIYPNGYGFDPFIHRATVNHIVEFGTITPKPMYYIGQYSLELTAEHVFSLPVDYVDPFLVPILASLILVFSVLIGFSGILNNKPHVALASIFLLPLSPFIVTTPQALAYLFTAGLLFLSLPKLLSKENTPSNWLLAILTAAAIITHPLAGIPAAIYFGLFLLVTTETGYPGVRKALVVLGSVVGSIALPLIFMLQAKTAGLSLSFEPQQLFDISKLQLSIFFDNRFSSWYDAMYLVIENAFWILIIFAAIGTYFAIKQKAKKSLHLPLLMAVILFLNYWILATSLEFEFLIEYERANYALRLLFLTSLFLIPAAGIAITGIHQTLSTKPRIMHTTWMFVLSFILMSSVYGAYPRHDNYARSSGFNVGTHDFDAVYAIDDMGEDGNYVVLANQAVSSAALQSFGFKTYYKNEIFYYPIPTGGELYSTFLNMVEEDPTHEYALEAMDLTNVDTAYFVVNDYWWKSDVIKERAKLEADDWFSVGDGQVTVFIFERPLAQ